MVFFNVQVAHTIFVEVKSGNHTLPSANFLKPIQALAAGFELSDRTLKASFYLVTDGKEEGWPKFFGEQAIQVHDFVPENADSVTVTTLDQDATVGALLTALSDFGEVGQVLEMAKAFLGIDPRKDLLEHLKPGYTQWSQFGDKSEERAATYLPARDEKKLRDGIDTLVGRLAGMGVQVDEEEFEGIKIRSVKFSGAGDGPKPMSWGFSGGGLIVGTKEGVEQTIRSLKAKPAKSFKDSEAFRRLSKRLPEKVCSFSYANGRSWECQMNAALKAFKQSKEPMVALNPEAWRVFEILQVDHWPDGKAFSDHVEPSHSYVVRQNGYLLVNVVDFR
jgi:hypothetical protein